MLRLLREHLLQDIAGLELILVGLIETVSSGEERERIENASFAVVRIPLRELLHLAHVGGGARAMIQLVMVGVKRRQCLNVIPLALRF